MNEKDEYKDLLEVSARIWEVRNGKPTKIRAMGINFVAEEESKTQIYEPEEILPNKEDETELIQIEPSYPKEDKDKGIRITSFGTNSIFENVLADIKDGISRNEGNSQLIDRIAPYYPDNKPSSYSVYLSAHRRYLKSEHPELNKDTDKDKGKRIATEEGVPIFDGILEKIKLCNNDTQEMREMLSKYYDIKEKSIKKYVYGYRKYIDRSISPEEYKLNMPVKKRGRRRKKPKGSIGKDDTYNTWIMPDEYANVKRAINKWEFVATTESIADITGLKVGRIRAIIHWMLKKHEIYISRDKLTPIYHSVI